MKPYFLKMVAPVPKIESFHCALFVGPHPDDIEVGAGATVSRLVSLGIKVFFVIVTDGGAGSFNGQCNIDDLIKTRRQEALNSASHLGVDDTIFLNFPDGAKYDVWDVSVKLAEVMIKIKPDIVFCPDPDLPSEVHPDHIKTGQAVKYAMLISSSPLVLRRNLIHVETDSLVNFNKTLAFFYTHRPNKYLPLTNEDVIKANQSILLHKSQFQEHDLSWKMLNKYLSYRRKRFGNLLHPKCDGFFVLGPIHQHSFPEINHY